MRTIRVTGSGQIKVRPDLTRVTVTLNGLYKEYGETLRRSSEDTEALGDVLSGLGFGREDLKTLSFGVEPEYETYKDRNGLFKQRFAGYRFRHCMKLEFPSDNERLGRVLYALSESRTEPELRISYTVSDPEGTKNALLGKAVADAKEKADVLTRAGGVRLLDIQSIDYSWGELNLECRPMNNAFMARKELAEPVTADSFKLDVEPDDIMVSDTVTVVWEIE